MATIGPLRSPQRESIPIDARAADHLRYIRETMERAAEFTAVPGWGGVAMGVTALVAALAASRQTTPRACLAVWLIEAFVAVAIAPPIVVGGLLTFSLYHAGIRAALPGVWLLLYGTAIVTGGAFSVRVVPVLGLCLMSLGGAALFAPAFLGDAFMAAGFGVVQMGFGWWIARHYGG